MSRLIAIGDIHGCHRTFRKLLLEELKVLKEDEIVCIGDYIDRGPDSKAVVDLILELRAADFQIHTLRGNHEQIMLDSVKSEKTFATWLGNGGDTTLRDFGVGSYEEMATPYREFFQNTEHYITRNHHIFVHAGLNFEMDDPFDDLESMLWIRNFEIEKNWLADRVLVHGHTPKPLNKIKAQKKDSQVINIDSGCVYDHKPSYGYLTALICNTGELISIENVDSG